jgi:penicillin amidase
MIEIRQQRVLDRHAAILLGVFCLLGVLATAGCRRTPPPQPPLMAQVSGTLAVPGLAAPVRVVRDTWGVPHIYAASRDDLFVAQGFVQAQDRLFQMDLWRRSAQGRLSEVLGPNFIERDAMTRRMQYRGGLDEEWASYGPDARAIADAFVRGVNAWVALARERPPEEFALAGWQPEPWRAEDLLNRTEAFTASGDALDEVFRARLTAAVGGARARQLLPGDRGFDTAAGLDVAAVPDLVGEAIRRVGTPPFFLGLAGPVTAGSVRLQPDRDPMRTHDHPSLRYLVHLNAPGWNVIGATAPWRPGVAVGHNERIGWTAEPFEADTQDVYVEKLNPDDPRQVQDGGGWIAIDTRKDFIAVRGRKTPVDFTRETTRHGVIVASDLARHLAFALRWSGSEPGAAAELAAPALDRAASWPDFRAALARWKMPARRMTVVDTSGGRASETAALVPLRLSASLSGERGKEWSGALPAAGWTGAMEWRGFTATPPLPAAASSSATAARLILESVRRHPDRGDALLQALVSRASSPDALTAQRAAIVDALAEALRDRERRGDAVLFAHPLAVTAAARSRFNIALRPPASGSADPFAIAFDAADWDRSTAINAPGQSGSPDSPHFADLAALWSDGKPFPLAFTDQAVNAHAASTLTLTPR